jgi:2-iminobutanoate/2-iminopropanoate deaminase
MNDIRFVKASELPAPAGHYSPAVVHGGVVYISGQLGRSGGMSDEEAGDVRVQVRRALSAIEALLRAAGSSKSSVLKVNVYVPDVSLWPVVNEEYARFMGEHRPARAVIPTAPLHFGALVEIDAIAVAGTV